LKKLPPFGTQCFVNRITSVNEFFHKGILPAKASKISFSRMENM